MLYKNFLGYRKGADGNPKVVEEEATIVRTIYRLFLEGQTPRSICQYMMDNGILLPGHKQLWWPSTVSSILTNEKYRGDAVLQKCFTTDFLTKKQKKNEGEVSQYLVKNSHPPIIAPIEFDMVQAEFERRRRMGTRYSCAHILSSKLVCGDCGGFYAQKVWHSNDPGRCLVWQCNDKFKGEKKCQTPILREEQIKELFLKAYNQFVGDRTQLLADCIAMMETVANTSEQDKAIADIMTQLNDSALRIRACISEHAETAQTEEAFEAKRQPLVEQHRKLEAQLQCVEAKKANKQFRERQIRTFIESLRTAPLVLTEWDDTVWQLLLDKGTVAQDGSIAFEFKGGTVVTVNET